MSKVEMDINERNRLLSASYTGRETNFWFQGRLQSVPHDGDRERRIGWWRNARIGFFPHWSPMAGPGRGGAAVLLEGMSPEENRMWCESFLPRDDVAAHFADCAVAAGAKYIVVTTKHCDGLKMWDSAVSPFNSVNVGCGRDLVREQVDAARARGMRVGLYYSPSEPFPHLDERYVRDNPLPDSVAFRERCAGVPALAERFRARIHAEMRELCTQYGPIDIWWNDGPEAPHILPPEQTWQLLRGLQPDMLINDRLIGGGNEELFGDFATQDYNESPKHGVTIAHPGRDWETGYPINGSWSHVPEAVHDTATVRQMLRVLYLNISERGNLLLSVDPDYRGTINPIACERLGAFGQWVQDHAEVVYGHGPRPVTLDDSGKPVSTMGCKRPSKCADWIVKDGKTAYLWVLWWPGATFPMGGVRRRLRRAVLLKTGKELSFTQDGERVVFENLPAQSPDRVARINVIRCELDERGG